MCIKIFLHEMTLSRIEHNKRYLLLFEYSIIVVLIWFTTNHYDNILMTVNAKQCFYTFECFMKKSYEKKENKLIAIKKYSNVKKIII